MASTVFCSPSPFQIRARFRLKPNPNSPASTLNTSPILRSHSSPLRNQFLSSDRLSRCFQFSGGKLGFPARATNVGGTADEKSGIDDDEEDAEFRGVSTMPDRFKFKAEPEPVTIPRPPRWVLLIGLACFIYSWRMVLWELRNWRNTFLSITQFLGYLMQLVAGTIDYFLGDPISYIVHTFRSLYSSIVSGAPVPELTTVVILASSVLAIAEATSPNSIAAQPYLLTASGVIGYVAVGGYISEPLFWTMLLGLFLIARLIKKRDYVSPALPVATVLASVGEPWVRALAIVLFLGLAVHQHWKKGAEGKKSDKLAGIERKLPVPLAAVAMAIGMRVAAQWAGYRHLTWKIV